MDKLDLICRGLGAVLGNLKERRLTVAELRILMALKVHGELKRSDLMTRAGFTSHNQSILMKMVGDSKIDRVRYNHNQDGTCARFKYSINHIGYAALKRALKEVNG